MGESGVLPEIKTYLDRIGHLRGQVWKSLEGLDAAALDWRPLTGDTNSLLVLATHSIGAEHGWISEILAQGPKTRNRPEEFRAHGESLTRLREIFQDTGRESERALTALTAEDLDRTREDDRDGTVTVRWIILHVIEHYAEHLGQMRLTRQLWENRS